MFAAGVYVDEPWSSVLGCGPGRRGDTGQQQGPLLWRGVVGARDPCAMHPAGTGSGWQGVATEVLVKGTLEGSGRLETRPIYVRIVEVAGSSPVTSPENRRSGESYSLLADSVPVWRARALVEITG